MSILVWNCPIASMTHLNQKPLDVVQSRGSNCNNDNEIITSSPVPNMHARALCLYYIECLLVSVQDTIQNVVNKSTWIKLYLRTWIIWALRRSSNWYKFQAATLWTLTKCNLHTDTKITALTLCIRGWNKPQISRAIWPLRLKHWGP